MIACAHNTHCYWRHILTNTHTHLALIGVHYKACSYSAIALMTGLPADHPRVFKTLRAI
jgi:hypothetical protein